MLVVFLQRGFEFVSAEGQEVLPVLECFSLFYESLLEVGVSGSDPSPGQGQHSRYLISTGSRKIL